MIKKKKWTFKRMILFLLILLLVVVNVWIQFEKNEKKDSFKNSGYGGNALFMDTLKRLGYDVDYVVKPIDKMSVGPLIVINLSGFQLLETDQKVIEDLVKSEANILVLHNGLNIPWSSEDGEIIQEVPLEGKGTLMIGDVGTFSNIQLIDNRETSYEALKILHPFMDEEGVVFNEYYLFMTKGNRSLWAETPVPVKFVIYQLMMVLLLLIWNRGKRFGAPRIHYEETQASENQYAIAVGELYLQAGHWETVYLHFYEHFMGLLQKKSLIYFEAGYKDWLSLWKDHIRKETPVAHKVYEFSNAYQSGAIKKLSKRQQNKKFKEVLHQLQTLEKILEG